MLLPASTPLPCLGASGLSVLSWNVLIPNSDDGWWIYKMYRDAPTDPTAGSWESRSKLLRERLRAADADIVCLQETSDRSFEADWAFMADAGYECALLNKGRMRPATFWKSSRLSLCSADGAICSVAADAGAEAEATEGEPAPAPAPPAVVLHGDRTLTTMLRLLDADGRAADPSAPPLLVVNCHLSAGNEARRRLRQVHETLEQVRKMRAKAAAAAAAAGGGKKAAGGGGSKGGGGKGGGGKGGAAAAAAPERVPLIVCGDFNSQGSSGVRQLLVHEEVGSEFRESGDPTEPLAWQTEVTSKLKKQPFGPFIDAAAHAYAGEDGGADGGGDGDGDGGGGGGGDGGAPPPTLVASELMAHMVTTDGGGGGGGGGDGGDGGGGGGGAPSEAMLAALDAMFDRLSADGETLSEEEQSAWLVSVNRQLGRGSEYRAALAAREARGGAPLTRADFRGVYAAELAQGTLRGVAHGVHSHDPSTRTRACAPPRMQGHLNRVRWPAHACARRQVLGRRTRPVCRARARARGGGRSALHGTLRLPLLHGGRAAARRPPARPTARGHAPASHTLRTALRSRRTPSRAQGTAATQCADPAIPSRAQCTAHSDRAACHCACVSAGMRELLAGRGILPNRHFPSDHLPVAAVLEFVDPASQ